MALVPIRIGSATDIHQYDHGDFAEAIETTEPIAAGAPVDADHVLILDSISTLNLATEDTAYFFGLLL